MQNKRHFRLVFPALLLLFLALACNFPREGTPTPSGPEMLKTYAAQTIQVQLTLVATGVQPTFTPGPNETTITPSGPSATIPSESTPTPTSTQGVCDQAGFEKDVTIPDNTVIEAGQAFTKTWRLRNDGVCTWNSSYVIVFDRGDSMGAPPSVPLTAGTVNPGETVDVSVDLMGPEDTGTYQGYWKLRNQAGQVFGLGKDRDKDFWVKIKVGQESGITFDFNIQAKSATWIGSDGSGSAEVPYDGADDNPDGVVKLKDKFNLENGKASGVALVTGPKKMNDGRITGTFPPYTIGDKDRFKAKLGFQENCTEGIVIFHFSIKEGENIQQLGSWSDACDGLLVFPDVDLSAYADRQVQFVLDVLADGTPINNPVVWGSARIERE
jgi:hypothetical protein